MTLDETQLPLGYNAVLTQANVELIGWVEFKREGKYFPRTFLSFVNSRIEAPEGADGYAITFRVGYAGKVRKIIELPEEEST